VTWQRSIRGVMLTLDDVALVARGMSKKDGTEPEMSDAPAISGHNVSDVLAILAENLHPWPD